MKVSLSWLKELVDYKESDQALADKFSLQTIAIKELTPNFMELDMKGYNRADLLSMRGVAMEVSAITDSNTLFGDTDNYIWLHHQLPKIEIQVDDHTATRIYCVAKIEGLKVAPSDPKVVKRLTDSGLRSVNNLTDVTNLMMLEYGQPLHAFDADIVKNESIMVRHAKTGEKLITLDNKERILEESDILITDSEKVLGIAGVMGGKSSEITDTTKAILLEAAIFDPISIRKTATRLSLNSEASKRFQHGLTIKNLLQALDQAIIEYQVLGGKLTGLTIVGNTEDKIKTVNLSLEKVNSLIGVTLNKDQVESYLLKLGFKLDLRVSEDDRQKEWEVTVPYWRLDIEVEEDLIEEIARLYGYDKIPSLELKGELSEKVDQSLFETISNLKTKLVQLGLTEVFSYSFFSTKVLNSLGWENNLESLIKLENPMSKETTYLRNSIWPNLVEIVDKNLRQEFTNQALFEVGKVYQINKEKEIDEYYVFAGALLNETDNPVEELYNVVTEILRRAQDDGLEIKENQVPEGVKDIFHPKRFMSIERQGQVIGGLAEVHPRVLDKFGINKRVAVFEIKI